MIMPAKIGAMDNEALDALIREIGSKIDGQLGFWQFELQGVTLYCITDETHDRMRLMTPIVEADMFEDDLIRACMEANYDRSLDARYCINDDTLWGAFIHPLSLLRPEQFQSACSQVTELSKNYGTTFSSGELRFGS